MSKKKKKLGARKNHGFDYAKHQLDRKPTQYLLGVATPRCIAPISKEEFKKYLPEGELQFGKEDFMDCASRSPVNVLEAKLNKFTLTYPSHDFTYWLVAMGYGTPGKIELSDRFVAILSKTTKLGNSLIAPLHTIHECGVIPKKLLPREASMTWAEYHDKTKITQGMKDLGLELLSWLGITYWETDSKASDDIDCTAGFAWPQPKNGVYPRTNNQPNHAFITVPQYEAFDNYEESPGDFYKDLAPDYNLIPGYRLVLQVKKNSQTEIENYKKTGPNWLIQILRHLMFWRYAFN